VSTPILNYLEKDIFYQKAKKPALRYPQRPLWLAFWGVLNGWGRVGYPPITN
jgi:hypothetical protein